MQSRILLSILILLTACQTTVTAPTASPRFFPTVTLPPTLQPVTFTPAPTFTLEPSPTPLPRFFTNEFDSSLAGWVILQAGSDSVPSMATQNSSLILQMDSPYTWVYAIYGAQDYADVHIEAQSENRAVSPSALGLVCRYSEDAGWFEYNILTDGTYNVLYGKWLANGVADYFPIIDGSSKEIGPGGTSQQIGLTCSGTTLQLFLNENIIRSVNVSSYELAQGKIGLTASSFENIPVIAAYDWVKVSEP